LGLNRNQTIAVGPKGQGGLIITNAKGKKKEKKRKREKKRKKRKKKCSFMFLRFYVERA
jgi:hypothetical protein